MSHDVFISYSSHDQSTAHAVCAGLEGVGVRCWIAPRDIPAGRTYAGEIVASIKTARVMVVIFSSHSNGSANVMREVERAIHAGATILPFRIENVNPTKDMEYFLSVPHWLDALTPPLETHIERLRGQIRQILDISTPAPFAKTLPPLETTAPQGIAEEVHPDDWSRKKDRPKGLFGRLLDFDM